MQDLLLSVIIPVYKVEQFLHRCMQSILNERCERVEIWLIDDGSPDRSGVVCDSYAASEPTVHVLHQPNGGVSSARNSGLDRALGEWVWFIDSDDTITPGSLKAILRDIAAAPDEVCALHYGLQKTDGHMVSRQYLPQEGCTKAGSYIGKLLYYEAETGPVTYVFRRSAIRQHRFSTALSLGEDTLFDLVFFEQNASRMVQSFPRIIYNYLYNADSATNSTHLGFVAKYAALGQTVRQFVQQHSLAAEVYEAATYFQLYNAIEVAGRVAHLTASPAGFSRYAGESLQLMASQTCNRDLVRLRKKHRWLVRISPWGALPVFLYLKLLYAGAFMKKWIKGVKTR